VTHFYKHSVTAAGEKKICPTWLLENVLLKVYNECFQKTVP